MHVTRRNAGQLAASARWGGGGAAAGELDQPAPSGFPRGLVGRPRWTRAGVTEGARDEPGGDLVGGGAVAGGCELEESVVLVAAAEGREPQGGLAAGKGEHAVEVAVVLAV